MMTVKRKELRNGRLGRTGTPTLGRAEEQPGGNIGAVS